MFPVVPAGGRKPKSLPAFIVAGNGIFLRKESALGISQARVQNVAHLPHLQPELEYRLPPIPKKLSAQIAGFLLICDKQHHSEGALLLCLDKKGKWRAVAPRQQTTGGDVKYFVDPDTIPDGWTLAGTVHSHPFNKSSAPTASWTDESDERKIDGVHLVAGSLEHQPKYGAAVVVDGTRFKYLDWQDLIEPAEPDVDAVPPEWLERITKKSFAQKVASKVASSWSGSSYSSNSKFGLGPFDDETPEDALRRHNKSDLKWLTEDAKKLGFKFEWRLEPLSEEDKIEAEESSTYTDGKSQDTVVVGAPTSVNTPSGPMTIIPYPGTSRSERNELAYGSCPSCQHMWLNHKLTGCVVSDCYCIEISPLDEAKIQGDMDLGFPPDQPKWRGASPIRCTGKHPGAPCPVDKRNPETTNCGCHCEPCRKKMVGAYDASQVDSMPTNEAFERWEDEWVHNVPPRDDECACKECYGGCYAYLGMNATINHDKTICDDCVRGSHYMEDGNIRNPATDASDDENFIVDVI